MKNNTTVTKRITALVLSVLMLFSLFTVCAVNASAADYPLVFPKEYDMTAEVGTIVQLTYSYFPCYKNERINIYIYDQYDQRVAYSEKDFYNSDSSMIEYTLRWDTRGYDPGRYKVVAQTMFYTYYDWHQSPRDVVSYVTLVKKGSIKGDISKAAVGGIAHKTYTGKNIAQNPKVKVNGKTLTKDKHYTLTYSNNKNIGTAKVTITGIRSAGYTGSKTMQFYIVPAAVKKIVTAQSNSAIAVKWSAVAGGVRYKVFLYKGSELVASKTTAETGYKFENVLSGTTYKVVVRAYKTVDGKNYWSPESTVKAVTKPGTPTLAVAAGSKKAVLKWTKQGGCNGYEIYMAASKSGAFKKIATIKDKATISYTKTGLVPGRTYYFKVRAYKTSGTTNLFGAFSAVKAVKVK